MNQKDRAIRELVAALPMAERNWVVVDHWDGLLCAIGIAHADRPRRLVYVSTSRKRPGRYDYECEVPNGPDEECFEVRSTGEDVDFPALMRVLEGHLAPESEGTGSGPST